MRISDWSSDVCSSDLRQDGGARLRPGDQICGRQSTHCVPLRPQILLGPSLGGMAEYTAPLRDMRFVLEHVVDLDAVTALAKYADVDRDAVYSVLEENARFMEDKVAPLNRVGDLVGSVRNDDGTVTTPAGFVDASKAYVS